MDLSKTIAEGAADLERGHSGPSATPAARCCSGPRNRPAVEDTARQCSCSLFSYGYRLPLFSSPLLSFLSH